VSAAAASPAGVATSSRHEVSERIGSGRSLGREQSRRRAPGGRKPPGPWPVKPRLEPFRKERHHPKKQVRREIIGVRGPVPTGLRARAFGRDEGHSTTRDCSGVPPPRRVREAQSPRRANRGSGDRAVVLAECFGCRSRRAALGPLRLTAAGLASPPMERWGERASEAGSRRQSCENGGGFPSRPGASGPCVHGAIRGRAAREDRVEGALVEGRRPGPWRQPSLTRRRAEADLVCGAGWLGEARRRKPSG